MDELITEYAARLQKIYDDRTVGDRSFNGVLSEFLERINDSCGMSELMINRHRSTHD